MKKKRTTASASTGIKKEAASKTSDTDFFKALFEQCLLPMWVYDVKNQRILEVNQAAIALYGFSREEFSAMTREQLKVTDHELPKINTLPARASDIGAREELHQKKNGVKIHVEVTTKILSFDGTYVCVESIVDISKQKKKQQLQKILYHVSKVAETSAQLAELYRSVHKLIREAMVAENFWIALYSQHDNQIRYPYFVDTYLAVPPPRTGGRGLEDYVVSTKETLLCTQTVVQKLIEDGALEVTSFPSKIWLGVPLIVQETAIGVLVVHDYENENAYGADEIEILEYVATQVANAIERRLAVLAIKEHEDNLSALIENTEDAIWSLDNDDRIITFNKAARDFFNTLFDAAITEGARFSDLLPGRYQTLLTNHISRAKEGNHFSIEIELSGKINSFTFDIAFNPILNEQGKVEGVSIFAKDITTKKRSEEVQSKRTETIIHHQRVLTQLAKIEHRALEEALSTITQVSSDALRVEQVSIWMFDEARRNIFCQASYQHTMVNNLKGVILSADEYPRYFKELESSSVIVADNALTNPATSEFVKNYLQPMGITSMMDVPVHLHGKIVGIICFEHVGEPRRWELEDQEFAVSIADVVSIALETDRRKRTELALQESEERYRTYLSQTSEATWRYELTNPVSISLPIDEQIRSFYDNAYLAECNDAMARMYGLDNAEQLVGAKLADTLVPTEAANIEMLKTFIASGYRLSDVESTEFDNAGNQKCFLNNFLGIVKDGMFIRAWGTQRDITERKNAEKAILESELRFRILAETVAVAIIIYQGEKFVYANPAAEVLLNYTREELYRMKFWEVVHPEYRELIRERGLARQRGEDIPTTYEFKLLTREGEQRWVDFAAAVINYQGAMAVLGTAFDITERKRVEELQSAVYRIAQAAEGAKDVEELFKAVHSIIDEVMPAKNFYIALYDDENDIVSFPYFVDEEDPPPEARRSRRGLTEYVIRTGRSLLSSLDAHQDLHRRGEIESIGAMSPIWLGVPLSIGGKTIGVMTVQHYSDPHAYGEREQQMLEFVSTQVAKAIEKKRTEELLRSNEKRYRTLIENSSDVVALIDKTGRVIYESPAIKRVLGFTSEERMGKNSFELIHPDDMIRAQEALRTLLQHHGAILPIEIRVRHSNGSWRWLEAVASNLLSDPNIQAIVVNYRDITERKQSVEALQDSEERFRSLFESATDAIFTLSLEGIVTSLNPAFEKITGWRCEEWIGRSMSSLIHEEDIAIANRAFSETLKGNIHPAYELRIRNKAGNYIVGEFTTTPQIDKGNIVGVLGIARDITERKKLEDQIRYIQKMESIGILAGGVAHDFNNILAIINAYAGSLKLMAELPPQFSHNIKIIEQTVKRGARIVQQLLMLAKKSETVFSETTICPIIEEVSKLAHETFPKTITFDIDLKDCNVQIPADGNQLYQVFLNLCLNARDAMPSGGTLLIKSFLVNGSLVRKEFPEASKEEYLAVSISDTGIGIDEETKDHIFEPFFTTKEFGKGTGLGLSVVYGIIQAHKGFIGVDSELNKGTTFIIYLPLHEQTEEKYLTEETFQVELRGGEETILLVEDEENLLDLLVEILQSYGYRILKARDGEEAVSVFRENQTQIKLVMSDLGLPKLGGYEAFLQMKKLNPNVKVILASGYKDTKVYDDMIKAGAEEFVQKPYNISEVIKKIRDALDSVQ